MIKLWRLFYSTASNYRKVFTNSMQHAKPNKHSLHTKINLRRQFESRPKLNGPINFKIKLQTQRVFKFKFCLILLEFNLLSHVVGFKNVHRKFSRNFFSVRVTLYFLYLYTFLIVL